MTDQERIETAAKIAQAVIDTAFAMVKGFEGTDLYELGKTEHEVRSNIIKAVKKASEQVKPQP